MTNELKAKTKLQQILQNPFTPFFVLWIILQAVFLSVPLVGGDEVYYGSVLQRESLTYFLKRHYYTWSPRSLVEIVEIYVSMWNWIVWRFLHPAIVTAGVTALSLVINKEKKQNINWLLVVLILLYHWENMSTAGWISTTLVYVWPAVACIVAFVPLTKAFFNQKFKLWQGILSLLLLLYGTNTEQTMFVYVAATGFMLIYKAFTRSKISWLLWAQAAVAMASAIYIAFCPGEHARYINDVTSWFKNFGMLSIFTKLEIGLVFSAKNLLFVQNFIFTAFCFFLFAAIYKSSKSLLYRAMGLYPLCVSLIMGFFSVPIDKITNVFALIKGQTVRPYFINLQNANQLKSYVALLIICSVLGVIIVNLYIAFGHNSNAIFAIAAFAIGYASYGAMGFAPTTAISGLRTGFLCEMVLVALAIALFKQANFKAKQLIAVYVVLIPCALLQLIVLFTM